MIIALDGPAASGKGTLAKRIADHFGFHHLDTGLLYRAIARDVRAIDGSLMNIFSNNGQICIAGSRILVQRSIADKFIACFVSVPKSCVLVTRWIPTQK